MDENEQKNLHGNPNGFMERRHKKKDWVVYAVSIMSFIGWLFAIIAFSLFDQAKPMHENFFTRLLNVHVRKHWNASILYLSFYLMLLAFASCIVGFILNMRRHRRKTDRYNKTIILLGIVSSIFLVVYLWKFWYVLF